jgi:acetyl-CoA acetyltransferase
MRDVWIVGAGMSPFGVFPDLGVKELGAMACLRALKDAGVKPNHCLGGFMHGDACAVDVTILHR